MNQIEIERWIANSTTGCPHIATAALSEIRNGQFQHASTLYRKRELEVMQQYPELLFAVLRMVQWYELGGVTSDK